MTLLVTCPAPAAISGLTPETCKENLGQITRLIFQRTGTPFADEAAVQDIANWNALKAAIDGTKVQAGPIQENFVIPSSEAIAEGGDDNTTTKGQEIVLGGGRVTAEGRYRGLATTQREEIKQFIQESQVYNNLGVYLVNEHGKIIGNNKTGTEVHPFPINSYFMGSRNIQGFNTNDFSNFRFALEYDWDKNLQIITPNFDANDPAIL